MPVELEKVFESANPALLSVARSLLQNADIEYVTTGESSEIVFPGIPHLGKVSLSVDKSRAAEARELLRELEDEG